MAPGGGFRRPQVAGREEKHDNLEAEYQDPDCLLQKERQYLHGPGSTQNPDGATAAGFVNHAKSRSTPSASPSQTSATAAAKVNGAGNRLFALFPVPSYSQSGPQELRPGKIDVLPRLPVRPLRLAPAPAGQFAHVGGRIELVDYFLA